LASSIASDCVCLSLRMASRVITRTYDRALAPAGITTNAYAILARLELEGPMPLGALAARLAVDRTTLSREVDALAGLVETERDPDDGRRRLVSLTDEGAQRVAAAAPLWARAQAEVASLFAKERTAALRDELHALVEAAS
jgi:DNA-binding MarR family transcriptional regulator